MKREPEDLLESSPYHGSMVHGAGYTKFIFSYARLIYVCRNTAAAIIAAAFLRAKTWEGTYWQGEYSKKTFYSDCAYYGAFARRMQRDRL